MLLELHPDNPADLEPPQNNEADLNTNPKAPAAEEYANWTFSFVSADVMDVIYNTILPHDRRVLHSMCYNVLRPCAVACLGCSEEQ